MAYFEIRSVITVSLTSWKFFIGSNIIHNIFYRLGKIFIISLNMDELLFVKTIWLGPVFFRIVFNLIRIYRVFHLKICLMTWKTPYIFDHRMLQRDMNMTTDENIQCNQNYSWRMHLHLNVLFYSFEIFSNVGTLYIIEFH